MVAAAAAVAAVDVAVVVGVAAAVRSQNRSSTRHAGMGAVCSPGLKPTLAVTERSAIDDAAGLVHCGWCSQTTLDSWYACHGKLEAWARCRP